MQQRHAALEGGLIARAAAGWEVHVAQPLGRLAGVIVSGLGLETDWGSTQKESNGKRTEHRDTPED
jgi:hypothetical protein